MKDAKSFLDKIKQQFNEFINPAPPVQLAAPVQTPFKLQDGTDIMIGIDDPSVSTAPDAGDTVWIGGTPAPAGDYTLDDGTAFTVDATGVITVVVAPVPATQPQMATQPSGSLEDRIKAIENRLNSPVTMAAITGAEGFTAASVKAMYDKFATGSTEERISNLETMIKALMDAAFGYQIRQGQEADAITAYKNSLVPVQTAMAEQKETLSKQGALIGEVVKLAEMLLDEPSTDPKAVTETQKLKLERVERKKEKHNRFSQALNDVKILN